ncbi:zinc ABC transporter substrate-binding protein [Amaricoccus sp.]|uniref:zinc ABC transporter substrate-binding protein n=1 Tax=Amaricoccus sp. TaxID=1872485 RepID=UPI001B41AAE2|nr:zinc ABC transporter substrate-binding protein [Amaricoccus sp.]MBP7000929.1 zinc ABC transporter substrate-binding protein [Amaricoccus sp.]
MAGLTRPGGLAPALSLAVSLAAAPALASPRVVADIAPVHSIVAAVMGGLGAPTLLVQPGASEHDAALRPSDAAALDAADVVVWIGPGLTPWLEGPIDSLAGDAARVTLADAPGIRLLPRRVGGTFEAHEHGHAEEGHDDHGHDDHGHDDPGHDDHDHDDHDHDHDETGADPHLWLDPANAAVMAGVVAEALAAADPANADAYRANAAAFGADAEALTSRIAAETAPARGRPFVVFHDAYHYFEDRFGLPAAGAISTSDAAPPGAVRIAEIRALVRDAGAVCVFSEPQFDQGLVETVIEGTPARAGVLDPLGAGLAPGPELYTALLDRLADGLVGCLAPPV